MKDDEMTDAQTILETLSDSELLIYAGRSRDGRGMTRRMWERYQRLLMELAKERKEQEQDQ